MFYLVASSLVMVAFYALYWLLLRRLTFYSWNRFYLLAALALSLMIPLIELPQSVPQPLVQQVIPLDFPRNRISIPLQSLPVISAPLQGNSVEKPLDQFTLIGYFYLLGTGFMALRLGRSLWKISRLIAQRGRREGSLKVIPSKGPNASFFHWIFINETGLNLLEQEQVLAHEAAHARLMHSADRLLSAFINVFYWFNPVLYLIEKSLIQLHELQVDALIINQFDRKEYAHLLVKLHTGANLALTNTFSQQALKDRVRALFTQPSKTVKKWMYLGVIPAGIIVTLMAAQQKSAEISTASSSIKRQLVDAISKGKMRMDQADAKGKELIGIWSRRFLILKIKSCQIQLPLKSVKRLKKQSWLRRQRSQSRCRRRRGLERVGDWKSMPGGTRCGVN